MRTTLQSARVLIAILTLLAPPGTQAATILLDDGGVHTISGPSGPVAVSNGTTLNIQDGAVIAGGSPSISIDPTSTFTATGGSITGVSGTVSRLGSVALSAAGATTISGGTFQGGGGGCGGFSGVAGAEISGPATISGGTFQGGGGLVPGPGAEILGPATISGGTFQGSGSGRFASPGAEISGPATISGGTFQGDLSLTLLGSPSSPIQIRGGLFANRIDLFISGGEVDFFGTLTFTGGRLTGVLADGTALDQPVSLGANITVLSAPSEVRFLGTNAAVPEPPSLVLLGTGLLGALGAWRLRRGGWPGFAGGPG